MRRNKTTATFGIYSLLKQHRKWRKKLSEKVRIDRDVSLFAISSAPKWSAHCVSSSWT